MTAPAIASGVSVVTGTIAAYAAGQTGYWSGTAKDRQQVAIPLSAVALGTIRLVDEHALAFVNDRDLVAGATEPKWKWAVAGALVNQPGVGVSLDATSGALAWEISSSDTAIADEYEEWTERAMQIEITLNNAAATKFYQEHRLLICRRPLLCTAADVRAKAKTLDEHQESQLPFAILEVTDAFERVADRKILKLYSAAPARETHALYPDSNPVLTVRLGRYPIDTVLGAVLSDEEAPADWDDVASVDSSIEIDRETGRLSLGTTRGYSYLHVRYAGGWANSTGQLPWDLRRAAAKQVLFDLMQGHRPGQDSFTTGTQQGGFTRFKPLDGNGLLAEVAGVFRNYGRIGA